MNKNAKKFFEDDFFIKALGGTVAIVVGKLWGVTGFIIVASVVLVIFVIIEWWLNKSLKDLEKNGSELRRMPKQKKKSKEQANK